MSLQRNGAVFELGECKEEDLARFVAVLGPYPLQLKLVQGLYALCGDDPERRTDMANLTTSLNTVRPTLINHINRLCELGMMIKETARIDPRLRSRTLYRLQLPSADPLPVLEPPVGAQVLEHLPALSDQDQGELVFDPATVFKGTDLSYHPDIDRNLVFKGER